LGLDVTQLSHNPAVVQAYREDTLVHHRMTARAYHEMLGAADAALAQPADIAVPTLLLYGEEDHIVSVPSAQRWFEALHCRKRSAGFRDAYHELHHEMVREEVLRLVREWITAA
jgi:alpha-beta hydrolase superfamily lysophospholipase